MGPIAPHCDTFTDNRNMFKVGRKTISALFPSCGEETSHNDSINLQGLEEHSRDSGLDRNTVQGSGKRKMVQRDTGFDYYSGSGIISPLPHPVFTATYLFSFFYFLRCHRCTRNWFLFHLHSLTRFFRCWKFLWRHCGFLRTTEGNNWIGHLPPQKIYSGILSPQQKTTKTKQCTKPEP